MVQFNEFSMLLEETPAFPRLQPEGLPFIPELDMAMPRVYRQPAPPPFTRRKGSLRKIIVRARHSRLCGDGPTFGTAYGEITSEFQPALQWARSCWEYLLSTQGCRFLPRQSHEKLYNRGDFRAFTENDYQSLIHRSFKECLLTYIDGPASVGFEGYARKEFWGRISEAYRALEKPADPNQRKLTSYSYLRCVPYQFLNSFHHQRVCETVEKLPFPLRQVVQLYHLSFYTEEVACAHAKITYEEFRRRRWAAFRAIATADYLSYILLRQIERY